MNVSNYESDDHSDVRIKDIIFQEMCLKYKNNIHNVTLNEIEERLAVVDKRWVIKDITALFSIDSNDASDNYNELINIDYDSNFHLTKKGIKKCINT
jgi:hypothetical protein